MQVKCVFSSCYSLWILFLQFDCHPCKRWSCQHSQRRTCHYAADPDCSGSPYPGHQSACCCWLAFVSCADTAARCRKGGGVMLVHSALQPLLLKNCKSLQINQRRKWALQCSRRQSSFSAGTNSYRTTKVRFCEPRVLLAHLWAHTCILSSS